MAATLVVIIAARMDMAAASVKVASISMLQCNRFGAHVERCCRKDGVVEVVFKVRVVIKEFGEVVRIMAVDFREIESELT